MTTSRRKVSFILSSREISPNKKHLVRWTNSISSTVLLSSQRKCSFYRVGVYLFIFSFSFSLFFGGCSALPPIHLLFHSFNPLPPLLSHPPYYHSLQQQTWSRLRKRPCGSHRCLCVGPSALWNRKWTPLFVYKSAIFQSIFTPLNHITFHHGHNTTHGHTTTTKHSLHRCSSPAHG